ncbi:hypothetical protein CARUB_v10006613mg [Capsella rubella]|uniref:Uncharacterized protein n=1 Tax=Capsella rubella TaxID=81985 RepID=R0F8A8_9BRAS|nr:uncharacterized protein LOC17877996 [Capsella rubella]EOA18147.1 hypothetical protein CARUB_v10006613mg [Capsella rubella]
MSLKSRVTSISSSHNLHHSEERVPLRSDSDQTCLNSSPEFDFRIRQNSKQRFSHADELFSDWKSLSHSSTDTISKKNEVTSPRSNLQTLAAKSGTKESDDSEDDPSFGCGFWLVRSKSVGYSMRNKKTNPSSEYQRSNSDPDPQKKKKKKSLQKMNSTEFRAPRSMNSPALNVPLADLFCLGPVFSGSRDRRK